MSIIVEVDDFELQRVREQLGALENKAPNVIAGAINRAVTNAKANVPKEIRQRYHVKTGTIKERLKLLKANASNLRGEVRLSGKVIGLNKFKVTPGTVNPNRKSQLKIAIKKGGTKVIPGAFNADLNDVKVFERNGQMAFPSKGSYKGRKIKRGQRKGQLIKREKIDRLMGPSVPQMAGNEEVVEKVNRDAMIMYEKRINHDINRLLSRMGG